METELSAAVDRIDDGASVAMGLALEHAIPFAAAHEIARQGISELTLVGPISDILFDQLIGCGLVSGVRAAWVGNVSTGIGYNYRRAVEAGDLDVEHHSNFSIALALKAAALGVPYLPTRSLLGSDIAAEPQFRTAEDPFEGRQVVQVPAIRPDWAVVHVQRAAPTGDAILRGNTGVTDDAVRAAENVLLTAEEVVDLDEIKRHPSQVRITREQVDSVAEVPVGAHPSPLAGRYHRDNQFYLDYAEASSDPEGFAEWADDWIHGVADREAYSERVDDGLFVDGGGA